MRRYARSKIDSINSLGEMTLLVNETVIVHSDYKNISVADFEVVYFKNSEEESQTMQY